MKIYKLERKQFLPISLNEGWNFFSNPENLNKITPDMGFVVTNNPPENIYSGLIITYIIKPLAGFPLNWVTEITHVEKPNYFVDEQRFGPYKFWHHTHRFIEVIDGIEMIDTVYYGIHFGFFGQLFEPIIVKPKLEQIFNFRYNALEQYFGKSKKI
jgi:ligand-binding SRPBCC domain-containing protein